MNAYRDGDIKAHRSRPRRGAHRMSCRRPRIWRELASGGQLPTMSSHRGELSMAKRRGRGVAAINYPTGMNLGGDPRRLWSMRRPPGISSCRFRAFDLGQGIEAGSWRRSAPRPSACRPNASSSTPPTPIPAPIAWAPSPVGHPPRRQRRHAGRRGARGDAGGRRRSWRLNASDLETDGKGNIQMKGVAAARDLDLRHRARRAFQARPDPSPGEACSSSRARFPYADGAR